MAVYCPRPPTETRRCFHMGKPRQAGDYRKAGHWRPFGGRVKRACRAAERLLQPGSSDETHQSGRDHHRRGPQHRRGRPPSCSRPKAPRSRSSTSTRAAATRSRARSCAAGGEAAAFVADVSSEADVEALVADVVGEVGPDRHPGQQRRDLRQQAHARHQPRSNWDRVIAVTLTGAVPDEPAGSRSRWSRRAAAARSSTSARPRASSAARRAIAYTAAKAGVANLTRAMAVQLAPHNIRVNCVVAEQDRLAGRQGRVRSDPAGGQPARPRRRADGPRARRSCSWRPTIPTSSSATCCSSTAGSPP